MRTRVITGKGIVHLPRLLLLLVVRCAIMGRNGAPPARKSSWGDRTSVRLCILRQRVGRRILSLRELKLGLYLSLERIGLLLLIRSRHLLLKRLGLIVLLLLVLLDGEGVYPLLILGIAISLLLKRSL